MRKANIQLPARITELRIRPHDANLSIVWNGCRPKIRTWNQHIIRERELEAARYEQLPGVGPDHVTALAAKVNPVDDVLGRLTGGTLTGIVSAGQEARRQRGEVLGQFGQFRGRLRLAQREFPFQRSAFDAPAGDRRDSGAPREGDVRRIAGARL